MTNNFLFLIYFKNFSRLKLFIIANGRLINYNIVKILFFISFLFRILIILGKNIIFYLY